MARPAQNFETGEWWECWPTARQRDQVVCFRSVPMASRAAPVGRLERRASETLPCRRAIDRLAACPGHLRSPEFEYGEALRRLPTSSTRPWSRVGSRPKVRPSPREACSFREKLNNRATASSTDGRIGQDLGKTLATIRNVPARRHANHTERPADVLGPARTLRPRHPTVPTASTVTPDRPWQGADGWHAASGCLDLDNGRAGSRAAPPGPRNHILST